MVLNLTFVKHLVQVLHRVDQTVVMLVPDKFEMQHLCFDFIGKCCLVVLILDFMLFVDLLLNGSMILSDSVPVCTLVIDWSDVRVINIGYTKLGFIKLTSVLYLK